MRFFFTSLIFILPNQLLQKTKVQGELFCNAYKVTSMANLCLQLPVFLLKEWLSVGSRVASGSERYGVTDKTQSPGCLTQKFVFGMCGQNQPPQSGPLKAAPSEIFARLVLTQGEIYVSTQISRYRCWRKFGSNMEISHPGSVGRRQNFFRIPL